MPRENEKLLVHWLGVGPIPPDRWGKDHKSTVLYAESRAVDHCGSLPEGDRRMRGDGHRYPTRLSDQVQVVGHSDFDCLADAEVAGFLTYKGGIVRMTETGWEYAWKLRRERAERSAPPLPANPA